MDSDNKDPLDHLFVVGYPGDVGGANTECWHTVRLWREFGVDVTLLPTWRATPAWRRRLDAIGCRTIETTPEAFGDVPGISGSVVVSFCNSHFLRHAGRFQDLGCKIVWLGCMNWLFAQERKHYRQKKPFDAYVFQSRYQQSELAPQLAKFGVTPEQGHRIPGAFFADEFPFRPLPHVPAEPFVVGRLSRAAADKYSPRTWSIYERIGHPMRARVMAFNRSLARKLGPPPDWAECLEAGAETPGQFLASLHCLLPVNGGAAENWPRVGLEAMAAGVPLVVEDRWGWREMVRHGETGYLGSSDEELAHYATQLAHDEDRRMTMARCAREVLQRELAHPPTIWNHWRKLFQELVP